MLSKGNLFWLTLFAYFYLTAGMTPARKTCGKSSSKKTYSITVTIKNIRNTSGRIQLDLYRSQAEFKARKGVQRVYISKRNVKHGTLKYVYKNIDPGYYGLALLDDENSNGAIDYGWFTPKEGFGFGDYYHTKWKTPHFDDFKFYLNSSRNVTMQIRYM